MDSPTNEPFLATFAALAQAGLHPCLLRADPNPLTWRHEIDLVVSPRRLRATLKILRQTGWEIHDTAFLEPSRRHLYFWSNGRFLQIDLYTAVLSGGLEYIDGNDYVHGASLRGPVSIPTPANWLFHVVVNTVLERQCLREDYLPRVESALQEVGVFDQARESAEHLGIGFLFEGDRSLAFLCDAASIAALRPRVRAALKRARMANRARIVWQRFIDVVGERACLRTGFSIAAVGPDGSGKSSFLQAMKEVLDRNGMTTQTVYFGPWERQMLPTSKMLYRIGASPREFGKGSPYRASRYKFLKGQIKRLIYYANFLPEMWARYVFGAFPTLRQRQVVLFDRHPIDLLAGYYNEPIKNMRWLRNILARLSPRPSIFVFLDNDAKVIWSRKKEFPLFLIEKSLEEYRKLAQSFRMIRITTDRPTEDEVLAFIDRHWRTIIRLRRDGFPFKRLR